MRSLWLKLAGAFVVVVVVGLATVTLLSNLATTGRFRLYVSEGGRFRAQRLALFLADYYVQNRSWEGVEILFQNPWAGGGPGRTMPGGMRERGPMMGPTMGPMMEEHMWADRLILADEQGTVVADSYGELVGQQLSEADMAGGVAITVEGQRVGTLIVTSPQAGEQRTLEDDFLRSVNRSILLAGLVTGALALALGLVFFRQITAPLRALTEAAQGVAAGDLNQRVEIHSQDELGQLGHAFNTMTEALARQEELRRNMVADIAHELRTPLSVIRGNLEALLDDVFPLTKKSVASVHKETLLLSRLVGDLQELALAEAGQLTIKQIPLTLKAVLEPILASIEPQTAERGLTVELDLPPDLPPVSGDPDRLRQIFLNLLSNSLRHTPGGGQITISARQEPPWVEVHVADTGQGIAPEDLPHIFDRFYRPNQRRDHGGTGLGLAIVRHLVEVHGGHIRVESQVGKGTTFIFTLPAVRPENLS
jgi:signal transduction histidine kinase